MLAGWQTNHTQKSILTPEPPEAGQVTPELALGQPLPQDMVWCAVCA